MDVWAGAEPREPVGAIFPKPEIIELILDPADYRPENERLAATHIIEPSCGDGAFLVASIRRLLAFERLHLKTINWFDTDLECALTACDLNSGFYQATTGSRTTNSVRSLSLRLSSMRPPCATMISRHKLNPNPLPPVPRLRSAFSRKKR